jgi:3-carboxy-cis,cis-muconate cycloisomerase
MDPEAGTVTTYGLFGGLFARGGAARAVQDDAWVRAMLDVEVALAGASADAGRCSPEVARRIERAAAALVLDPADLGRKSAQGAGNPVPALVRALTEAVDDGTPQGRDAAGHVHRGATSQDVIDTATCLVTARALPSTLEDLRGAADRCAELASRHRNTPIIGRTLLQQAVPTTFGLKAASWMCGLDEARAQLGQTARETSRLQLGGAVGTLSGLGDDGLAVHRAMARRLGLGEPVVPWHTVRVAPALLVGAIGAVGTVVAKIALDVSLLAQTEVGEAWEAPKGGRGGSSTMPHKRNPVAAVTAAACAARIPGLVGTVLSAGVHEHERAAGSWHAGWEPLEDLLRLSGSAAAWIRESLESLEVDPSRMADNIELTNGLVLAEAVTTALAGHLGRLRAHDLVTEACRRAVAGRTDLRSVLADTPQVVDAIGPAGIAEALDPAAHLGTAGAFVDRALAAHRELA